LLGPQRLKRTLADAVDLVGVEGPIAAVTAGWEEREEEIDELREHLQRGGRRRVVNLRLYHRAEDLFLRDPEFAAAYRERRLRLRELQDYYRLRLGRLAEAARDLQRRDGSPDLLDPEREDALADIRALDRRHLERTIEVHREFEERWRPAERPLVASHRSEVAWFLGEAGAVALAGGNVAVLGNRLRLFGVAPALARKPIFAWSAGAMAIAERVVLFHDSPPQGPGHPEVFGRGLALARGILPLPHASRRLRLGDADRVAAFARRFAPDLPVAMEAGSGLIQEGNGWRPIFEGARRLDPDGLLAEVRTT
jgi:hypothetical protein